MSEKRFTLTDWHEVKENGKIMTVDEVVGKLNEQQATINQLQSELKLTSGEKLFSRRELERKVKEQQSTIDRLKNAIRIAYEEKPYPKIGDIKAKYKELEDEL